MVDSAEQVAREYITRAMGNGDFANVWNRGKTPARIEDGLIERRAWMPEPTERQAHTIERHLRPACEHKGPCRLFCGRGPVVPGGPFDPPRGLEGAGVADGRYSSPRSGKNNCGLRRSTMDSPT